MNQTNIKNILVSEGINPSKKMGQNFLSDENVARWIVDQIMPDKEDVVVEIGPGTGALTEHLVGRVKYVILIEFDTRLAQYQKQKYQGREDVEVHHFDAARFDTRQLYKYGKVKLIGNLPYSSGGAIIRNFMKQPTCIVRAVLMLQKEFVDRIVSRPRRKSYGVLSLRMQSQWVSNPVKTIPPEAFHPRPSIDSVVMVCTPLPPKTFPAYDPKLFDELIRRGFAQRRKQVRKQMPRHKSWEEVVQIINIPVTARAEEISLDQWVEITRFYDDHPLKNIAQCLDELFDVVNEKDEVIRQEKRSVVHSENLFHRAVHILVFNKNREVFLQKRSFLKDTCPGAWGSSAAGHLNSGETYQAGAIRELKEELGVECTLDEIQKIGEIAPSESTGWEFVYLYLTRHDGAIRLPCSEVDYGMWMNINELSKWIKAFPQDFAPGFMQCWHTFINKIDT